MSEIEIEDLAGKVVAAFLVETAKAIAGPVTKWLQQRLGTRKAAEQLAVDVDDGNSKAKLMGSVQQELEADPSLESELRKLLDSTKFAPQTAKVTGDNATIIQIRGDNSKVQR